LRTFSKAYGLAGLRVGYAVADPSITAVVQAATMPFATSVPAQVAVLASLAAGDELDARVSAVVTIASPRCSSRWPAPPPTRNWP